MDRGRYFDRESLGGRQYRHTQYIKPRAHLENGVWRVDNNDFTTDAELPNAVWLSQFGVSVDVAGLIRVYPTVGDYGTYFEWGDPWIKQGGVWEKHELGSPTRSGNRLTWATAQANVYVVMGGHYIQLGVEFKNGWVPEEGLLAFGLTANGVTRSGSTLLVNGEPWMSFGDMQVVDLADETVTPLPVAVEITYRGKWFLVCTLPDMAGMVRPCLY